MNEDKKDSPSKELDLPEVVVTIDEDGVIQSISPSCEQVFGFNPDEIIGDNVTCLMGPDDALRHDGFIKRYLKTGTGRIVGRGTRQVTGIRKDGQPIELDLGVSEVDGNDSKRQFFGVLTDATKRLKNEARIRTSEERFRSHMYGSLDAIFYMQAVTDDAGEVIDFEFTDVNDRGVEMTKFSRDQLIGGRLCELMPDNVESGLYELYKKVYESGEPFEEEHQPHINGVRSGWIHHQLVPIHNGLAFYTRDISDRKAAEHAILESQRQLHTVVSNMPMVMFELDAEGIVKFVDGKILQSLNLKPDTFVNRSAVKVWGEESDDYLSFLKAMKGEESSAISTYSNITFDTLYTPIRKDNSNEVIGVLGLARDVTRQLKVEQELRQAHKMRALGQLTGGIAHDFNNLLAIVMNNLELLDSELDSHSELHELVRTGIEAAERGSALTQRLVAFGHQKVSDPDIIDLSTLLSGMGELLQRILPESIDFLLLPDKDSWHALADFGQLENAILNLCLNAVDAMPHGGELRIRSSNRRFDARQAEELQVTAGDYVSISVSDNGHGMEPEMITKIFEPFFTTKDGHGHGLGLSMVYGFITQAGGAVGIESALNKGTSVELFLPRSLVSQNGTVVDSASVKVEPKATGRVLIVEDNDLLRNTTMKVLRRMGCECVGIGDGQEALARLQTDRRFDALFVDVVLPGISGPEFVRQAKQLIPGVRVLLTSGYSLENSKEIEGMDLPVLSKPYKLQELRETMRDLLSK